LSGSRTFRELRLALLVFGCAATLSALDPKRDISQYTVRRWTTSTSFPGGGVNAFAQTNDGYLWIGAENGLARFDGSSFRVFDHANTPSLPAGHILGLLVDSEGVLWVRMESPYLLRYRGGVFEQAYPLQMETPGVTAMARDRNGHALVAEIESLARYDGPNYARSVVSHKLGGLAISIAQTSDGAIFAGLRDLGLVLLRGDNTLTLRGLPDQKVNVLLPGDGQDLWIGTDGGLARWNGTHVTQSGITPKLARSPVLALARDQDRSLWVSTASGVTRLDPNGGGNSPTANPGVGPVHAIFEDREGNLWLGGPDGLAQLRDSPFLHYPGTDGGPIYVDDAGRTWFAPAKGGLASIRGGERNSVSEAGLDGDVIYSIAGGAGELWVGRRSGALTRLYEENGGQHTRTFTASDGLAAGGIYTVHRARDGSIWAGTLRGTVSRIHKGRISTFTVGDGLSGDAITTILETPDGTVWAGMTGGLQAFRGGTWRVYGGPDGLPPGRVNSLAVDDSGVLWIGAAAGLFYWRGADAGIVRYAPAVLQGEILGVAADRAGDLWVASDRRVLRLSGRSTEPIAVREFGVSDGLLSTQLIARDRSVNRDPSGRIWFSLRGGLCVVDPARAAGLPPASATIESVRVDDLPIGDGAAARYPADRRRIVFRFLGVSLAFPERVRYRYRLDTYDADWSQPTEVREADYTNLAPGSYTFRLVASNGEGLWNGAEASVPFAVEPLLWQTWWFRVAAGCSVVALLFAAYGYRLRRIRAAMNLRFEERLAERTRIAQELHDTLLQGFLSASMQLQVAAELLPDGSKSAPLVARTLQLMQQVIEEGRNTVRGLRTAGLSAVPLETAFSQIKEEVGADNRVNFQVIVEGSRRELHPLLQDEVYRIGREALINAFRHAHAKSIEVELNFAKDSFRLFVRDDGDGIDPSVLEKGRDGHWGLVGMRERAERIGAQIHVFSRPSAGTEIELEVPANVAFHGPA
jgi:signal transduction histidine kinase/ligand-binding sensor domain-containing protein